MRSAEEGGEVQSSKPPYISRSKTLFLFFRSCRKSKINPRASDGGWGCDGGLAPSIKRPWEAFSCLLRGCFLPFRDPLQMAVTERQKNIREGDSVEG